MTAYRFRVKFDPDPTALWRDVVVGEHRTIDEFQATINESVGLERGHLWFVGRDEAFWQSDVAFLCPQEYGHEQEFDRPDPLDELREIQAELEGEGIEDVEGLELEDLVGAEPERYDAGETTVGEMADLLGLAQYDRICYLYDYGDEWRFYAILKEVLDDEPDGREPEVVDGKGEPVEQYEPADDPATALPDPVADLPTTSVPVADLHALEDRDDVVHVLVLMSYETDIGAVSERFAIQLDDAGYVLENYPDGWVVADRIDREDRTEEELLGALATAAREWHAEIVEIVDVVAGTGSDEATVEAMNDELDAELERKGFGHL